MRWVACYLLAALALLLAAAARGAAPDSALADELAARVRIYRDAFGTPHVDGRDDAATLFGFAFAQAEDNFWQLEDTYVLALGRYSELHGPGGLNSDLLNRAFQVVPHARAMYPKLDAKTRSICEAFAAGLNHFLASHPEVKPRLLTRFEPWHVLAYGRHLTLEMCFRYTRLSRSYLPRSQARIWAASGSNGWAIAPARTAEGGAMLMANPHLPAFGFSQLTEAHLRSGEGWNFSGATTIGNPVLSLGHNEHLGWTLTTNEPDVADVWRETFDDPARPLAYRYGDGYRLAESWPETIGVRVGEAVVPRQFTLRRTHHGPIVAREDEQHYLAANLAKLYESLPLVQALAMMRATNLEEFRRALDRQQFLIMNIVYADRAGNVFFQYNGLVPRRDASFDWSRPVDGSDPRAEWRGVHPLAELPALLNPAAGYVQNCNSSPFTTCREGNPPRERYPRYMIEDRDDDKRRAKRSRELLEAARGLSFDGLRELAFDNTPYWARHELPAYAARLAELKRTDPAAAARVEPYLAHLLGWDGRVTADSTGATLAQAWYERLYGSDYPAEKLLDKFAADPSLELTVLADAADHLAAVYGDWRVPWGRAFRTQRRPQMADLSSLRFRDGRSSLASLGVPGPMGAIFTTYYTPLLRIPLIPTPKARYAVVGTSYLGLFEFGRRVRGATAITFGQSGDPGSPHFFDQAELLADGRLKPERFYWDDVVAAAVRVYHPGEHTTVAAGR